MAKKQAQERGLISYFFIILLAPFVYLFLLIMVIVLFTKERLSYLFPFAFEPLWAVNLRWGPWIGRAILGALGIGCWLLGFTVVGGLILLGTGGLLGLHSWRQWQQKRREAVLEAITQGDISRLRRWLEHEKKPHQPILKLQGQTALPITGYTPLYQALLTRNEAVVRLLLKHGARFDQPLAYRYDLKREIINYKRQITPTITQETLLFEAIKNNKLDPLKLYLDCGFDPNSWQENHSGRCTPLYLATIQKNHTAIQALLAVGANSDQGQEFIFEDPFTYGYEPGISPLYEAVKAADLPVTSLLLHHGADPNLGYLKIEDHRKHIDSLPPLYPAIEQDDERMVETLLAHNADPNRSYRRNHQSGSLLDFARQKGNQWIIMRLEGQDPDPVS